MNQSKRHVHITQLLEPKPTFKLTLLNGKSIAENVFVERIDTKTTKKIEDWINGQTQN